MKLGHALLSLTALLATVAPAHGEKQSLAMLDRLDPGAWELRERGDGAGTRNLCLENGRTLIQLRHAGLACSSVIIEDKASDVTVQYTCRGRGYGRTHIRRESGGLIQLDSQGIVNGLPFAFAAEGRRTGPCSN